MWNQHTIQMEELKTKTRLAEIEAESKQRQLEHDRYLFNVEMHVKQGVPASEAIPIVTRLNERETVLKQKQETLQADRTQLGRDQMLFWAQTWSTAPVLFGVGFFAGRFYQSKV
jgi:hypothetical protein